MNVQVNPEILRWARTTAGLDAEEAARKLGFEDRRQRTAVQRLHDLERGAEEPSVSVLDRMAARYRRPAVVFYLATPPVDEEHAARFRSAPKNLTPADTGLLNAFVRDLRSRQDLLRDALDDYGDSERVGWIGSVQESAGRENIASRLRELLRLNLDEYRTCRTAEAGFELLRARAEALGVFVLLQGDFGSWQSALGVELFRGLSLADPVAPFVVINPNDAKPARSFTLLHEMVHLLLGQSEFADPGSDDALEQLCNDVAGELLLPPADVRELSILTGLNAEALTRRISPFAKQWRVSSSLVAYRASRFGYIDRHTLSRVLTIFEARWKAAKKEQNAVNRGKEGGPDYYVVQRNHLGNSLLSRTNRLWRAGGLTTSRAGVVLGVRATNVHALLEPARG